MKEHRRLEALADFDSIAQKQKDLQKQLAELEAEKTKKKNLKRSLDEPGDADYNQQTQVLQRKYLKIKDFLHMSRVSLYFLLAS